MSLKKKVVKQTTKRKPWSAFLPWRWRQEFSLIRCYKLPNYKELHLRRPSSCSRVTTSVIIQLNCIHWLSLWKARTGVCNLHWKLCSVITDNKYGRTMAFSGSLCDPTLAYLGGACLGIEFEGPILYRSWQGFRYRENGTQGEYHAGIHSSRPVFLTLLL